jgi:hypothetical protein
VVPVGRELPQIGHDDLQQSRCDPFPRLSESGDRKYSGKIVRISMCTGKSKV